MEKLYEVKQIVKKYRSGEGYLLALNQVDLVIEKEQIYTILGPSGSGKTTLLNMLSGLDKVDSGEIYYAGEKISELSNKELTKYRRFNTGFIFQSYNLISTLTVKENVMLGEFLGENPLDVNTVIEQVGLTEHIDKFPHQLSGGQQQRVAIARVLVKNPKVIFCDEPTGALDEVSGREILSLLQNLNREYQTTLIMVTHNPNIADMSHKVIYFKDGKIVDLKSNQLLKSAFEIDWS